SILSPLFTYDDNTPKIGLNIPIQVSLSGNTLTVSNSAAGSDNVDLSSISLDLTGTQDVVSGTGTNAINISHVPSPSISPVVSYNGVVQSKDEYTISGTTITFTFTIESSDKVMVNYSY